MTLSISNIYIHIADPIDDIRGGSPTEIVIQKPKIDVLFDYPLTNEILKSFYATCCNPNYDFYTLGIDS